MALPLGTREDRPLCVWEFYGRSHIPVEHSLRASAGSQHAGSDCTFFIPVGVNQFPFPWLSFVICHLAMSCFNTLRSFGKQPHSVISAVSLIIY